MIAVCDQKIVFKNAGDTVEQRTDTGGKTDGKHTGRNALPQCKIVQMNGYVFTFFRYSNMIKVAMAAPELPCQAPMKRIKYRAVQR